MKKLTTIQFIEKARKTHGNKYDYSDSMYTTNKNKIIIKCNVDNHGFFKQKPNAHLNGRGCPKCSYKNYFLSLEEFIQKAKIIHGNKYDYNKVIYTDYISKITITCSEHGDFDQTPQMHLKGQGCPYCAGTIKSNIEEFIEKARTVHGKKYDYSKSDYRGNKIKITMICPNHGEFNQTPNNHLRGAGCPVCKASKGELAIASILDKHNITYIREYKLPNYNFEYDFYLPDYRLLIEFHGRQHYEQIDYFGGEEGFKLIQKRDAFKRSLAWEYKLPLLEFNHRQFKHMSKSHFEELLLNLIEK